MKTTESKTTNPNRVAAQPHFSFQGAQYSEAETNFFSPIQAKLEMGQRNDRFEQEADSVADKVVQRLQDPNLEQETIENSAPASETAVQTELVPEQEEENPIQLEDQTNAVESVVPEQATDVQSSTQSTAPLLQKQEYVSEEEATEEETQVARKELENSSPEVEPIVPTKIETKDENNLGTNNSDIKTITPAAAPNLQTAPEIKEEEPIEEEQSLQKKAKETTAATPPAEEDKQTNIQPKTDTGTNSSFSLPSFESQLSSSRGSGNALPNPVQRQMGTAFQTDFSPVRIHTDSSAVQMSRGIGARAFTHGADIYFNQGEYNPGTRAGQHLLAHELTHTLQQGSSVRRNSTLPVPLSISDVTQKHPFGQGVIEKKSNGISIYLNDLTVKTGAEKTFLDSLTFPFQLPKPGSRKEKENKTKQKSLWEKMVREDVDGSLTQLLEKINTGHSIDDKKNPSNLYQIKLKKGGTISITGNFTEIKNAFLVPPWGGYGKTANFQIEHIVDYQIVGGKADDPGNLMLLAANNNGHMGRVVLDNILVKINAILTHYNKYITKGELVTSASVARDAYSIFANTPLKPSVYKYMADVVLFKEWMGVDKKNNVIGLNPLRNELAKLESQVVPAGHFILKTSETGTGIILPYAKKSFNIGSFELTTNGDSVAGTISTILAKPIITGDHHEETTKEESYSVIPVAGQTHTYKAKDFGRLLKLLKLKYLSPINFLEPEIDCGLNIHVYGTITDPTVKFLKGSPIEVELIGKTLSIRKTYSSENLGKKIGPFDIYAASLILLLDNQVGFSVIGGIEFKIDKIGIGSIKASATKKGFQLGGSFTFLSKAVNSNIQVNYDSSNDKEGEGSKSPWSIAGTIDLIEGMVKGVKSAKLSVKYENDILSGDGKAVLSLPKGIEGGGIKFEYGVHSNSFKFVLDLTIKGILGLEEGKIEASISSGEDTNSNGQSGGDFYFSIDATLALNLKIPGLHVLGIKPEQIKANYNSQTEIFDVSAIIKIDQPRKFKGNLNIGVSNRSINEKGLPSTEGAANKFFIYGFGSIEVFLTDRISSIVDAKFTPEGEVVLGGDIHINKDKPLEVGSGFKLNKGLFSIDITPIPIFTIGVGSVKLTAGGSIGLYANLHPLKISGKIGVKDYNLNKPDQVEIGAEMSARIEANAGLDFNAYLGVMATAVILYVEGRINVQMLVGAGAFAEIGGGISWKPDTGFQIENAMVKLGIALKASVELALKVYAGIDYWVGRKSVWSHTFPLASTNFPEIGKMEILFPVGMKNGKTTEFDQNQLLPLDNPLSDGREAGKYLQSAVTGEAYAPKKGNLKDHKSQLMDALWALPAIGPGNPDFYKRRGRYSFIEEVGTGLGPEEVEVLYDGLYFIENYEFEMLRSELLGSNTCQNIDLIIAEFHLDHTYVEMEKLERLAQEVKDKELLVEDNVCYDETYKPES